MPDIKVGDHVKVEFEGKVVRINGHEVKVDGGDNYHSWHPDKAVAVIPEPIVLPTKRNALIELEGAVLWFTGEVWESINEGWYPSELQKHLDARPQANYRVIFEGEDD